MFSKWKVAKDTSLRKFRGNKEGDRESNESKKYIYFPYATLDSAAKYLISARVLKAKGKAPHILVFESSQEKARFDEALIVVSSKKESYKYIKQSVEILSHMRAQDVLYISAHGSAGSNYVSSESGSYESVWNVAQKLVEVLKMPPDIHVKILTCEGASTSEIIFPKNFPYPGDKDWDNPDKVKLIYEFLDKRRGDFLETTAGQFETCLRQQQSSRALGLVSGYMGSVYLHVNVIALARNLSGGWQEVFGCSRATFKAFTPDGTEEELCFRRRDMRKNALDAELPEKTTTEREEKQHYVM